MNSKSGPAEELVLLILPNAPQRPDLTPEVASLAPKRIEPSLLSIVSPDPLLVSDIGSPEAQENPALSNSDPALQAVMLERYLGQISARVERLWVLPREVARDAAELTAPASQENTFRCSVQIRQDDQGAVQEVLLEHCPGTPAWRQSLVTAIFQASPLNAPPIPSVFRYALTMTFEAPMNEPNQNPRTERL